jgi:hypothetical protein
VDLCPNCGSPLVASEEKCPTCGDHVGFPNVRAASAPTERLALQQRYQAALERAELRDAKEAVADFRSAAESSIAVANCGLYLLRQLVTDENALYTNYYLGVLGEVRRAAERENDTQRRAVDALLFGGYADKIRFAALSLDAVGLKSYGKEGLSYGLGLRDVAIAKRASLLEENEYNFAKRHSLDATSSLPAGYRSSWENRRELAVAKLADLIWPEISPAEYAGILLNSKGDRATDQFIEVHIFGTFNINAVSSVSGTSKPERPDDRAVVTVVRELLETQGKKWIETL